MDNKCKICGGTVSRKGNLITCDYCGNRWISDETDDLHAVEWANAWQALRDNDFEKAAELFEAISGKEPENYEAFWGKALAQNGIVYVTELNENKRTPTCNNITAHSFLNDENVKRALALAPADIADTYREQAEKIERIRAERPATSLPMTSSSATRTATPSTGSSGPRTVLMHRICTMP